MVNPTVDATSSETVTEHAAPPPPTGSEPPTTPQRPGRFAGVKAGLRVLHGGLARIGSWLFHTPEHEAPAHRWVFAWLGIATLGGLGLGYILLELTPNPVPVYSEFWSDGLLLVTDPTDTLDLVEWVPRRGNEGLDGEPFTGLKLESAPLDAVYAALSAADLEVDASSIADRSGGVLRTLAIWGDCQLGFYRSPGGRLEVRIQARSNGDPGCWLQSELEMAADSWEEPSELLKIGPRRLQTDRVAILNIVPDGHQLPLRVESLPIRGLGFRTARSDRPPHRLYGGLIRLTNLDGDGDEQVVMNGSPLGRGHPIYLGQRVEIGPLEDAEILALEIGDSVHVRFRGDAISPAIGGEKLNPSYLQLFNQNNALVWRFALVAGCVGLALSVIGTLSPR